MIRNRFDREFAALPNVSTLVLLLSTAYTIVATGLLIVLPGLPTSVRIPLALPILLFTPGYAVMVALFPASREPRDEARDGGNGSVSRFVQDGVSQFERAILAVLTTVATIPLVALFINVAIGIDAVAILAVTALITVVATAVGVHRRRITAPDGSDSPRRSVDVFVPSDRLTISASVLTTLLLAASLAVAFTGGPVVTDGSNSEPMTEFYVVNETEDGDDVAAGYPKTFRPGEEKAYQLTVGNREGSPREYTIVTLVENRSAYDQGGDEPAYTELDRTETTVQPGSETVEQIAVAPPESGEFLSLRFLLYTGDAPRNPDPKSAHRTLEITIDVLPDES